MDNVNSKSNSIIDELIVNNENSQLHQSGLIIRYITKSKIGYGGIIIPTGSSYIDLPLWIKNKKACINIKNDDNKCFMFYVCGAMWSIWNIQEITPRKKTHYDNDKFKKEIPAIKYVNFEHWSFPMEIDDDEINEIDEFEKDNCNRISINAYGIHKDIKKHCEDSSVGEYMHNVESIQINNIDKRIDYW